MPFGLFDAPVSFQGYINKILAKKLNIFVITYTKDTGKPHVDAVCLVLDLLQKNGLFANLKKCWFYQNEVCFLGYVVLAQKIQIEDKRIDVVKNWLKPKSVRDIPVFPGFANFYRCFIQAFSNLAGPLTSMLKTTNPAQSSDISLSSIDAAEEDKVEGNSSIGVKSTITSKKFTRAD